MLDKSNGIIEAKIIFWNLKSVPILISIKCTTYCGIQFSHTNKIGFRRSKVTNFDAI